MQMFEGGDITTNFIDKFQKKVAEMGKTYHQSSEENGESPQNVQSDPAYEGNFQNENHSGQVNDNFVMEFQPNNDSEMKDQGNIEENDENNSSQKNEDNIEIENRDDSSMENYLSDQKMDPSDSHDLKNEQPNNDQEWWQKNCEQPNAPIANGYEDLQDSPQNYSQNNQFEDENNNIGQIYQNYDENGNQDNGFVSDGFSFDEFCQDKNNNNQFKNIGSKKIDHKNDDFNQKNIDLNFQPSQFSKKGRPKSIKENGDNVQYSEKFKRSYVIQLMETLKNQDEDTRSSTIKQKAQQIKIPNYELKIWLSSYKIIFKIEQRVTNQNTMQQILQLVEKQLYAHVLTHKREKRYAVIKILGEIVKNFGIHIKLDNWVKRFVYKYQNDFHGCEVTKRKEKEEFTEFTGVQKKMMNDKKRSKRQQKSYKMSFLSKKRSNNYIQLSKYKEENISKYPQYFKQNLCSELNEELTHAMNYIIRKKCEQFNMSDNTIRTIYQKHANPQLLPSSLLPPPPKPSLPPPVQKKPPKIIPSPLSPLVSLPSPTPLSLPQLSLSLNPPRNPMAASEGQLLSTLEDRLLVFTRQNRNCHVSALEKFIQHVMNQIGFGVKLKTTVRSSWLGTFLNRNGLYIDTTRHLKVKPQTNNENNNGIKREQDEAESS